MNWDDLRYLLAVQRRRTLAGAARELKVAKATVSRRLSTLEHAVGTRLVERKPAGLVLTPAGRALLETATGIESAVASVEARIAASADAQPRGIVRLTAPQWVAERLLIGALPELRARHPELEVELIGSNAMLNLVQHEADLAIRNVRPAHRSLAVRRIAVLGGCVYASDRYLALRGKPASRGEIAGHDVLVYESIGGIPGFEWLRDAEHGGNIAFRANDAVALTSAASAGLGLAALPCMLGDQDARLRRVPGLGFSRCDVFLVTHQELRRAARICAVRDFVVELFAQQRALIAGELARRP